ncbi:MAG: helix-turn-helix domain-containing protein [Nanoarchaeota archaeon]
MSKDTNHSEEIVKRLNVMIALALEQKEKVSEKEKIQKLDAFGLGYKDIAQILGKKPVNVAVVLNGLKKKK